jgi:hypothetical protein
LVMKKRWSTLCSNWNSKNHQPICGFAISWWKAIYHSAGWCDQTQFK